MDFIYHHHHLSLNREGRLGTTDDFTTSFLHFPLFFTALWDLANCRPVHSLMLSSHTSCSVCLVFFPLSLCLARWFWPDLMNGSHDHTTASLHLFTIVRRSSCGSIPCWIVARTSSLVTWSLYKMCSIMRQHLISKARILLCSSAVRVHVSQAHRMMNVTKGGHQQYLGTERYVPVVPNWFQPYQCCCRLCYLGEYLHRNH